MVTDQTQSPDYDITLILILFRGSAHFQQHIVAEGGPENAADS